MKRITLSILILFIASHLFAQKTETRSFSNFMEVDIRGDFDVVFEKGDKNQVTISSQNIPLDDVSTSQKGASLSIKRKLKLKSAFEDSKVSIVITHNNELPKLVIDGSCDVTVKDPIKVNESHIEVSGAGIFRATIEAKRLFLDCSGSTELQLKGEVATLVASAKGSSDINALELKSKVAEVSNVGSADAKIYVSLNLDAKVTGKGSIYYAGKPETVKSRVIGSGKIKKYKNPADSSNEDDFD